MVLRAHALQSGILQSTIGGENEGDDGNGAAEAEAGRMRGSFESVARSPIPCRDAEKMEKVRPARIRTLSESKNRAILNRIPHQKGINEGGETQKNS